MPWQKMITREATLLERYLKALGYAIRLPGTNFAIDKILIVAEQELPVMYFDSNELLKKLQVIRNDYKRKGYNKLFNYSCDVLSKLVGLTNRTKKFLASKHGSIIKFLKQYFYLYVQARAVVAYCIPRPELEQLLKKELLKLKKYMGDESLATLVYPVIKINKLKKFFHPNKILIQKKLALLKELKPSRSLRELIRYFEWRFYLHEVAEVITTKYSFPKFQQFLEQVAKRYKIGKEDLEWYLSEEILQLIKEGQKLPGDEIKKRRNFYVLILKNRFPYLNTGKKARMIAAKESGSTRDNLSKIKNLTGAVAQTGKIKGRVILLKVARDMQKVRTRSVIVSPMTRPQWMPAIRKAAGIVTDEGGMLSHAAIVARELKIPCIIGTKIATKVLKDGMTVEVDANRGIVKIIK